MPSYPRQIMKHKVAYYQMQTTLGGTQPQYASKPTFYLFGQMQPVHSELDSDYGSRINSNNYRFYFLDADAYQTIQVTDRIVFQGINYRVDNTWDLNSFGQVFRLDLVQDMSTNYG